MKLWWLVIGLAGCTSFLPTGAVEPHADGVTLRFPTKEGSMQNDNTWSKNMTVTLEVPAAGDTATFTIELTPHVNDAISTPMYCPTFSISEDGVHGITIPGCYESGSDERFEGAVKIAELAALPADHELTMQLCTVRYKINSNGIRSAIARR